MNFIEQSKTLSDLMNENKPPLLYVVHRMPYPPNKGDKLRSYHLLVHLAQRYRVYLATFVDQPEDWQHVEAVRALCEEVYVAGIRPRLRKLWALRGLLTGEALSLPYYRHAGMRAWVKQTIARQRIRDAVVFCSSVAPYVAKGEDMRRVVDFVDVDSAKWTRYAQDKRGLMAWLYRREGARLAAFERSVAAWADASVLVSEAEAALFKQVAPSAQDKTYAIGNGVNADFFSPEHALANPYSDAGPVFVFSVRIDYCANVNAA